MVKPNGEITITANGGIGTYQYSNDGGTTYQASNVFGSLTTGGYDTYVLDDAGCTVNQLINISDLSGPQINSTILVDVTCNGDCDGSIAINATNAVSYSIDGGTNYTTYKYI